MRRLLSAAAAIVFLGAICIFPAHAQNVPTSGILADGNALVTGFSGAQPSVTIPPGVDPADRTFIDLDGPAARVIDLQAPGAPPQAQLINAPKQFTVTASQIGQVFAVALDNATPPNIYLAATSVYGLPIVIPGRGGLLERVKQGAPAAGFMPGLFGPSALQGGPGSIWRIDGTTGAVNLFANVTLNGAPNPGPALGGLAFDPASNTLLVADRATGMIHGFDLNGTERGQYDHGTQGRLNAGLTPAHFNAAARINITDAQFQTNNPATWGYAPPERRIFGLAVRMGRLYYAVAEGLQIWSVGIGPGGFGTDSRLEITVQPGQGVTEISKITFDDQGRMLLAERAAPTGTYDFNALAQAGIGRVLRYAPAQPGPMGPSWQPVPDEYAIGFPAQMRNGNGGVAVGYGYDASGTLDRNTCGGFLWSSGEQLRVSADPALAAQLARGGSATVNGLQGNAIDLVRPANAPPLASYFVNYDDRFGDADARGHLGDVAIWRICAQAPRFGLPGLPGLAVPRPLAPPPALPPGPPVPLPPGPALPPGLGPQACPAGTHPAPGSQCCLYYMQPGPDGQCHSLCPPGSVSPNDAINIYSCWLGYAPVQDPAHNPATTCLDGTPGSGGVGGCPAPKGIQCGIGFNLVPVPGQWSDKSCAPTPQQQQCNNNGQTLGPDGQCHPYNIICPQAPNGPPPAAPWQLEPFAANQCCPTGEVPDPAHPGTCIQPQPLQPQPPQPPPVVAIEPQPLPVTPPPPPPPANVCTASLQCCPAFSVFDPKYGGCRPTLCPSGNVSFDAPKACYFGFQEPPPGQTFNPATGSCLDGSKPVQVNLPGGGVNITCKAPPNAACSFGYTKVPKPANITGTWTDFDCQPTAALQACLATGQRVGIDGNCYPQLCPVSPFTGPLAPWKVDGTCAPPVPTVCPVGKQAKFLCCPTWWVQDNNGHCVSPCANGATDAISVSACFHGYEPPTGLFNPATSKCKDGSTPVNVNAGLPPGNIPLWKCPAPADAACPAGQVKAVPGPNDAKATWTWLDFTCQQQVCPAGQTIGPAGSCAPNPCGPGTTALITCDPAVGPPPSLPPPSPACFHGYTRLPSGECCRTSQMTAGGVCCPSGQMPDSSRRSCVPSSRPSCRPGEVRDRRGRCVTSSRPSCGPGEVRDRRGRCVPSSRPSCGPGEVRDRRGRCVPSGTSRRTYERSPRTYERAPRTLDRQRSHPSLDRQRSNPSLQKRS